MSVDNISQILSRNISLLKSKHPLFINLDANAFINEFITDNPSASLTCFNTNFQQFEQHKKNDQYQSHFDSVYTKSEKQKEPHDLVVIQYPKAKAELSFTLAMLQASVTVNTAVIIVGEKNSGINSSKKTLDNFLMHYQKQDSARHCMIFSGLYREQPLFNIDEWFSFYDVNAANNVIKIAALPGVFSQKKLDIGTNVLLENLPEISPKKLLDFGCGAGVIACALGSLHKDCKLTLVDVSALALASAAKTLELNELAGDIIASNSLSHINDRFDTVVTNPPFHQGLKTNYEATETFLGGISNQITAKGSLIVVANNFLTYQPIMAKNFNNVIEKTNQHGFLVYHCIK